MIDSFQLSKGIVIVVPSASGLGSIVDDVVGIKHVVRECMEISFPT
jgi:hypothetical protein